MIDIVRQYPKTGWLLLGAVALVVALKFWAWTPSSELLDTELKKQGKSSQLIVMMHGAGYSGEKALDGLRTLAADAYPDADVLAPTYPHGYHVDTDPYAVASRLEDLIHQAFQRQAAAGKAYEQIILVGYSAGALLMRKAFVWGTGSTEDRPGYLSRTPPHPWTTGGKVKRLVLAAGMNRGWSLDPAPPQMAWYDRWAATILGRLCRIAGACTFMRSIERGSPFVADLRVQWLELAAMRPKFVPDVVQLLGTRDDVVTSQDDRDLAVSAAFVFIPVEGASHKTLLDFGGDFGAERKALVRSALLSDYAELKQAYQASPAEAPSQLRKPGQLVFLLHGIRDVGDWTVPLGRKIAEETREDYFVFNARYGYFPMGAFLLLADRQENVRWFMDQYTETIARHPGVIGEKGNGVSFVGHSNGTYILASALQNYRTLKVNRVAFAGSVVPRAYPWGNLLQDGRVGSIRNDLANEDWVVSIFPGFFEFLYGFTGLNILGGKDIGTGGFNGFEDSGANRSETYYAGGHGAAIKECNFASLTYFVVSGNTRRDHCPLAQGNAPASWVALLGKASWIIFPLIVILVAAVGFVVFKRVRGRAPKWRLAALGAYLGAVVLVLYSF